MKARKLVLVAGALALAVAARAQANGSEPTLYMAWHAPWGMPGASETLALSAADTTREDTLYLSFDPGQDAGKFHGLFARLNFHAEPGDTLGTYWHWGRGWWNQGNLRIEFDPDGTFPCPQPWTRTGAGMTDFRFDTTTGRLDLVYAVTPEAAAPVAAGTRYCFARVMFRQRMATLPGVERPVCLEWNEARLSFGGPDITVRRGGERFVSVNSPGGSVCATFRRAAAQPAWRPGQGVNPGPRIRR